MESGLHLEIKMALLLLEKCGISFFRDKNFFFQFSDICFKPGVWNLRFFSLLLHFSDHVFFKVF